MAILAADGFEESELFSPKEAIEAAGGTVEVKGLGLVESQDPRLMVAGERDIRQGDRFDRLEGCDTVSYEITYAQDRWHAFTICKLRQVD